MSLTISIHQPNYLPWLGYFYKMYASDVLVFLDDVRTFKKSITRRVSIRKNRWSDQTAFLSVPLFWPSSRPLINEIEIDHSRQWVNKHEKRVYHTYHKAPFFEEYFPVVQGWYQQATTFTRLASFNIFLIQEINHILGLNPEYALSSTLPFTNVKTNYTIEIIKYFKATDYISGTGARSFQDESLFQANGIYLSYADIHEMQLQFPYTQYQGKEFIAGLSILDALFNVGVEEIITFFKLVKDHSS